MKLLVFVNVLIILLGFTSCTQPPEYPIEPVIQYERTTKNTMIQGDGTEDETWMTISFTDGDGDIGFFKEGSTQVETDLFIRDPRLDAITEKFTIPLYPNWVRPMAFPGKSRSACTPRVVCFRNGFPVNRPPAMCLPIIWSIRCDTRSTSKTAQDTRATGYRRSPFT
ncbi:MAG: hypothetical protein IPJ40_09315 [Saprospirales bacterium]|nr:hypothetical protein [Saprospirales bacterium]